MLTSFPPHSLPWYHYRESIGELEFYMYLRVNGDFFLPLNSLIMSQLKKVMEK